jgi:hypothetical protein
LGRESPLDVGRDELGSRTPAGGEGETARDGHEETGHEQRAKSKRKLKEKAQQEPRLGEEVSGNSPLGEDALGVLLDDEADGRE